MGNKKKHTVDTMETVEEHLGEKTASEKKEKNAEEAIKEKYHGQEEKRCTSNGHLRVY